MTARTRRRFKPFRLILLILIIVAVVNSTSFIKLFFPLHHWDHIAANAQSNNIDPYFIAAIIKTESHFNSGATSPKGARGLMQIMPETGQWIAWHMGIVDFHPDMLYDPETNISMGAWYINNLQEEFGPNTVAILAAYNGGRGNVQKWLSQQIITDDPTDVALIPFPETKNFIRKVTRDYHIYCWLYQK